MQTAFLQSFLTIAETGSFSAAAQKLHTSQPALTQQMQTLEKELGFKLFSRNRRSSLQLTPAAQALLPELKTILADLEKAITRARETQEVVRIACIVYDTQVLPMSLYAHIQEKMPEVRLELHVVEKDVLPPLLDGTADFALTADCIEQAQNDYEYILLGTTRYMCVMSPQHPLADRSEITLEEMVRYPVSFSVPEFSASYNEYADQIRKTYPQLQKLPNYTHIYYTTVLHSQNICLSVCSAASFFQGMACVPLAEEWEMPYGLLYSKSCAPHVRRIANLVREFEVKNTQHPFY